MNSKSISRWDVQYHQRSTIDRAVERDALCSATCLIREDDSGPTSVEIGSQGKRIGTAELVWQKNRGTYRLGEVDEAVTAWVAESPRDRQRALEQAVSLDIFVVADSLYGAQPEWVDHGLYDSVSYVD